MKLTLDPEGTITHLHPNQLDNEQAVCVCLCVCVCVCVLMINVMYPCVHVCVPIFLSVCYGDVCVL